RLFSRQAFGGSKVPIPNYGPVPKNEILFARNRGVFVLKTIIPDKVSGKAAHTVVSSGGFLGLGELKRKAGLGYRHRRGRRHCFAGFGHGKAPAIMARASARRRVPQTPGSPTKRTSP